MIKIIVKFIDYQVQNIRKYALEDMFQVNNDIVH